MDLCLYLEGYISIKTYVFKAYTLLVYIATIFGLLARGAYSLFYIL